MAIAPSKTGSASSAGPTTLAASTPQPKAPSGPVAATCIRLRVVGLYYEKDIDFSGAGPVTTLDVLTRARNVDPHFGFALDEFNQIRTISNFQKLDFVSVRSGVVRKAGLYSIDDSKAGAYSVVWQYYIIDPAGVAVATNSRRVGDSVPIPLGSTLIFRAVAILEEPVDLR
jgi:hypothetical protein